MATLMRSSASTAASPLARRLNGLATLSDGEVALLEAAVDGPPRAQAAKRDLIREGEPPLSLFLITAGWGCRYKTLVDGRRQIVSILLPGDICDIHSQLIGVMDHAVAALTRIEYVEVDPDNLLTLAAEQPRIRIAFACQALVNLSIQREWTLNNGQRSALERIGHLFCEWLYRLRSIDLIQGNSYALPLTQNDLAEATGLTPVHVNRTLQEMRASNLIILKDRMLHIPDLDKLEQLSLFTPDYLHFDREAVRRKFGRDDAYP